MGKQNYRESIEKDRQEISILSTDAPSRRAQRKMAKAQPKQRKNILLPVLFFMFILIPVTILIFVAFFYEPDDTLVTKTATDTVNVEQNPSDPETLAVPAEDEEDSKDDEAEKQAQQEAAEKAAAEEAAKKETAAKEAAAKEAAAKETAAKEAAAAEAAAKEQAQREAAEAKAKADQAAEAKRQQEQAAAAKKEADKKAKAPAPSSKTHVVQPGETLYRIAVNNYGTGEAVEKIKAANGLSSNELTVGQTLVLP